MLLLKNHFLKALVKAYGRGQQGKMFKNKQNLNSYNHVVRIKLKPQVLRDPRKAESLKKSQLRYSATITI